MEKKVQSLNYFLIFHKDRLILQEDFHPLQLEMNDKNLKSLHLIGTIYKTKIFCAEWIDDTLPTDVVLLPLRRALEKLPPEWYQYAVRSNAIINWDNNHQFCGHCGVKTVQSNEIFEKRCPSCHLLFYPRISPSVIVLISRGDELLLARGIHFTPGVYGLIAGFVEAGETLEEAVLREVKEEVNISIKNLRYVGSQAWPFPDSLIAAFRAEYDSGELVIEFKELESANWFHYKKIPGLPSSSVSISRKLIDDFVAEKMRANEEE